MIAVSNPGALRLLILLVALGVMSQHLSAPIYGNFYFRQAHVAANIEKYLEHGLSLRPETYNLDVPCAIFDFPAYQLLIAALTRVLGTDPLVTARAVNLVFFALTYLVFDSLLLLADAKPAHRWYALLFFAASPMNLFYFQAPMVDCAAVLLALVSLRSYARWQEAPDAGRRELAALVGAGVLSTLIKNPVYLPVFFAIIVDAWTKEGVRAARNRHLALYVLAIAAAVVGFKIYSNEIRPIGIRCSSTVRSGRATNSRPAGSPAVRTYSSAFARDSGRAGAGSWCSSPPLPTPGSSLSSRTKLSVSRMQGLPGGFTAGWGLGMLPTRGSVHDRSRGG